MHRDEGIGMSREAALQLECSSKNIYISQLKVGSEDFWNLQIYHVLLFSTTFKETG